LNPNGETALAAIMPRVCVDNWVRSYLCNKNIGGLPVPVLVRSQPAIVRLWKTEKKCIEADETRRKTGYLEISAELPETERMEPTVRLELTTC
jgi:hypothetical protein